jgi:hypothetical protein
MKKSKQMRTAKPARSARPAEIKASVWQRLAQLPDRLREREEKRAAKDAARAAAYARIKPTAGDLAYERWREKRGRKRGTLGPDVAAKLLRLPTRAVTEAARSAGMLLDFGPSAYGWSRTLILYRDLAEIAKARAKAVVA